MSSFRTVDVIPLEMVRNKRYIERAKKDYKRDIPTLTECLSQVRTGEEFALKAYRLSEKNVDVWAALRKPRPGRYRPGWTPALDH